MKRYGCLLLIVLTACFSRQAAMTRISYDSVVMGMQVAELEKEVGAPDSVKSKSNGVEEYTYIERMGVNTDYLIENIYYVEILNGIVVGKHETSKRTPNYSLMYDTEPNFSPNHPQYNP